jgi:hypothetical protein
VCNTSEKAQCAIAQTTLSTFCKLGFGLATLKAILRDAVSRGLGSTAYSNRADTTAGFSKAGTALLAQVAAP